MQIVERTRPALRGDSHRFEDRVLFGLLLAPGDYEVGPPENLLDRYGWFQDNSGRRTRLPRMLRPNLALPHHHHFHLRRIGIAWQRCIDRETRVRRYSARPMQLLYVFRPVP